MEEQRDIARLESAEERGGGYAAESVWDGELQYGRGACRRAPSKVAGILLKRRDKKRKVE